MRFFGKTLPILCLVLGYSLASHSYLAIHESGKILSPGKFNFGLSQQLITDPGTFGSFTGHFAMPFNEESQLSFRLGTGFTDYHLLAQYKWIPYPDFEQQPAIGAIMGLALSRPQGLNETGFFGGPIVSKNFSTDYGDFDSYAAIPLYLVNFDGDILVSGHVTVGTIWDLPQFENIHFSSELGLKVNDNSFTYISFAAIFDYDEDAGFQLR